MPIRPEILVGGVQPADVAGFLFGGALRIQRHQAREQRIGVQARFEPVGLQRGGVEFIVQILGP